MSIEDRINDRVEKSREAILEKAKQFIQQGLPADKVMQEATAAIGEIRRRASTTINDAILKDKYFLKCCDLAGVEPSRKQASKFRRSEGAAWAKFKEAVKLIGLPKDLNNYDE